MPPARQPDRVPDAGNAQPPRDGHRVVLGGPDPVGRHGLLEPEPVGVGRTVARPIEARVVGEDLDAGPYDEEHEEQIKKMQHTQPQRKPALNLGMRGDAGMLREKLLKPLRVVERPGHRHASNQDDEHDRQDPQDVDQAAAQPDPRRFRPLRRTPGRHIDVIRGRADLRPERCLGPGKRAVMHGGRLAQSTREDKREAITHRSRERWAKRSRRDCRARGHSPASR